MPPWALPGKPRQGGLDVAMNIPRSREQLPQRFVSQPELNMFMYFIPTLLPSMLPGPPTSFSSVTTVTGRTRRDAPWSSAWSRPPPVLRHPRNIHKATHTPFHTIKPPPANQCPSPMPVPRLLLPYHHLPYPHIQKLKNRPRTTNSVASGFTIPATYTGTIHIHINHRTIIPHRRLTLLHTVPTLECPADPAQLRRRQQRVPQPYSQSEDQNAGEVDSDPSDNSLECIVVL